MNLFITTILLIYGAATAALTAALFGRMKAGTNRASGAGVVDGPPGVSVVIPFRNEERNIVPLLESLAKQSYGGETEVILVNDRSDDNGVNAVKEFLRHNDNTNITIKIIDLEPPDEMPLTSKQRALDLGVSRSSHPLIAFTDADMLLAPEWIESLAGSQLSTGAALVFGHTSVIDDKKSLFTLFEAYQLELLFSFAHAFAGLNLTGSCMGNNILVTKEAYRQCGGQRGVGRAIVEDRALLKLMRRKGFKTCSAEPFTVTARTYPSRTKRQFFNQAMRWARGGLRPGGGLFAAGLLLLTQNVIFLLSVTGIMPWAITVQSVANFLLTWIFLSISFHKNGSPAPKLLFPAYYVFMMAETVIFGLALILRPKIDWKGRKFHN